MTSEWDVFEFGVDWATLTAKTPRGIARLKGWADAQFEQLEADGFHVKPVAPMGYDGWQVGPVFGGARADGFMLRVSGAGANVAATLWGEDVNITRLDVQATLRSAEDIPGWGQVSLFQAETEQKKYPRRGGYPHMILIDGRGRGDSVLVGSRTSDRYGRMYDKARESEDPAYERCWRYEIEFKGAMAVAAMRHIAGSEDRRQASGVLALAEFREWRFPVPAVEMPEGTRTYVPAPYSDNERRLAWLKRQVEPTIRQLRQTDLKEQVDIWIASCYTEFDG